MRVHLIRSEEVSLDWYSGLVRYLQSFPGPIVFIPSQELPSFETDPDSEMPWKDKSGKVKFPDMPLASMSFNESRMNVKFDEELPMKAMESRFTRVKWQDFFSFMNQFRRKQDLGNAEYVVMLTDHGNEHNWFSAPDLEGNRNFFVQTSGWEFIIHGDAKFPVAYQVVTNLLRYLFISNLKELETLMHMRPRGCVNDFNQDKREIVLKLRTADLCPECTQQLAARKADPGIVNQIFEVMESIRSNVLFRERFELSRKPSRLLISGPRSKIIFSDLPNTELLLTPLEKTVYFFFLQHPEGVSYTDMPDHEGEIVEIYRKLNMNQNLHDCVARSKQLINPMENSLSEKVSRINRKIELLLGPVLAEFYLISGQRGQPRKIGLDRILVTWMDS